MSGLKALLLLAMLMGSGCREPCQLVGETLPDSGHRMWTCTKTVNGNYWMPAWAWGTR